MAEENKKKIDAKKGRPKKAITEPTKKVEVDISNATDVIKTSDEKKVIKDATIHNEKIKRLKEYAVKKYNYKIDVNDTLDKDAKLVFIGLIQKEVDAPVTCILDDATKKAISKSPIKLNIVSDGSLAVRTFAESKGIIIKDKIANLELVEKLLKE